MDTSKILAELHAERDRIDQAITVLEALSHTARVRVSAIDKSATGGRRTRRRMSAAARKRISEAAKRRWATKKNLATSRISAAGRKRISEAARKMWAERRKTKAS